MTATGLPQRIALEVLESLKYHEECGCAGFFFFGLGVFTSDADMATDYAGKTTADSRRHLARPTRTWSDFVRSTDWSSVLV